MENPFGYGSLLFFSIYWSILIRICTTLDTITPTQSLGDGDTLVSPGNTYELGFFSLAVPNRRYLGLWYKNIYPRTYVWVANRETPLSNNLGTLNLTTQGNLVLLNLTNHIFWQSNTSRSGKLPVAQLLDTGNFIVRDPNGSNSEKIMWQSFDFPGNILLPGMKLGANFETGLNRFLSSWKSSEDPAKNEFSLQIDVRGYPQLVVKKGTNIQYRPGSWNGQRFSGAYMQRPNPIFTYEFVLSKNEVYYKYELKNSSIFTRFMINPTGLAQFFIWNYDTNDWMTFSTASIDQCENYAFCGAFARCDTDNSSPCSCLDRFIPKSESYQTSGCRRRIPLNCSVTDGFLKLEGIKLPDTSTSWFNRTIGLEECRRLCLSKCSCNAYANLDITGSGSGCLHWLSDLIDIRGLPEGGQDFYVRLSSSELGGPASNNLKAGIITGSVISSVTIMLLVFYIWRRKARQYAMSKNSKERNGNKEDMDLPLFNLITVSEATNDFSSSNKLGEGGFGAVYKGTLVDGQEIAVKRLSKSSGQGLNEFKNEVLIIAKLQHRNLVKLLGCCIHEDEKMLIYEYMPNRSLDFFIFDQTRSKFVDWHMRINIIDGIARGLVYLHQDSRLKIIHRDLKTSNILLDGNMNPKISDFGLARTFGVDQSEANTRRVVGTYGYMSPEYAVDGHFSVKSDVFSFGVLVLEIISGKKNRGFCHAEHGLNLLGHSYTLWIKGMPLELIDECLKDSYNPSVVIRCINMALLCVQQRPEDRPNMSTVVVMLSSENPLPPPKEPGFFLQRNAPESDTSSSKHQSCSANEVSISLLEPR